jgi:hypothetical protein
MLDGKGGRITPCALNPKNGRLSHQTEELT